MAGRYARRVDANQQRVVSELRDLGYSVSLTHAVAGGFPDLAVGRWGRTVLVELKNPDNSPWRLTSMEQSWHEQWKGCAIIAESAAEIDEFMQRVVGEWNR